MDNKEEIMESIADEIKFSKEDYIERKGDRVRS